MFKNKNENIRHIKIQNEIKKTKTIPCTTTKNIIENQLNNQTNKKLNLENKNTKHINKLINLFVFANSFNYKTYTSISQGNVKHI